MAEELRELKAREYMYDGRRRNSISSDITSAVPPQYGGTQSSIDIKHVAKTSDASKSGFVKKSADIPSYNVVQLDKSGVTLPPITEDKHTK